MRTLKRSECTILPLVLKGEWYDMIAIGEKRESAIGKDGEHGRA